MANRCFQSDKIQRNQGFNVSKQVFKMTKYQEVRFSKCWNITNPCVQTGKSGILKMPTCQDFGFSKCWNITNPYFQTGKSGILEMPQYQNSGLSKLQNVRSSGFQGTMIYRGTQDTNLCVMFNIVFEELEWSPCLHVNTLPTSLAVSAFAIFERNPASDTAAKAWRLSFMSKEPFGQLGAIRRALRSSHSCVEVSELVRLLRISGCCAEDAHVLDAQTDSLRSAVPVKVRAKSVINQSIPLSLYIYIYIYVYMTRA